MGTVGSVIVGTGSHLPPVVVPNEAFLHQHFRGPDGAMIDKPTAEIVQQFEAITGIRERRHVAADIVTSDIAAEAAHQALASSGIDGEELDYIILAHNFGDVRAHGGRPDQVPSLAARVKTRLGIKRPQTVALDLVFGCSGWLQGVIHADYMIRSGEVRRVMVIGAETLSRVCDPDDRDSMIYADGAGAVILEGRPTNGVVGILTHAVRSDTGEHSRMLSMGPSFGTDQGDDDLFLKMEGRKLYRYALCTVPVAIKECLERAGVDLGGVAKLLLHQANAKMNEAILTALYGLYGRSQAPPGVMPMTISWLGNSSVATLPTLLDLLCQHRLEGQRIEAGDVIVLAAVGAGMHVSAVVYRLPA
jgi:3-oxoacyl-[acyl-carrier-protein] synthase III